MASPLNFNAFEVRQLLHAQPFVGTVQDTVFGVIKSITKLNLGNKDAVDRVWWPFIKRGFKDLCMYGFVAYYKKTVDGVVVPVHVPMQRCTLNYSPTDGLKVSPKNADQSSVSSSTAIVCQLSQRTDPNIQNSRSQRKPRSSSSKTPTWRPSTSTAQLVACSTTIDA